MSKIFFLAALSDIRGRHIALEDVANAIRDAKSSQVEEGRFGAGSQVPSSGII